jgi:hypothetical protein
MNGGKKASSAATQVRTEIDSRPDPPDILLSAFPFFPIALSLDGISIEATPVSIKNKHTLVL